MNIVINHIRICASIEDVFDLATTARYWPKWHPSTIEVGGTITRPYQLGDTIWQVARIDDRIRTGTWSVTEHSRPNRVVLQMYGGEIEVRYTFVERAGDTQVIRRLTYTAALVDGGHDLTAFERLMHAESALGLQQLKLLIEGV